jgi:hypothetical protein
MNTFIEKEIECNLKVGCIQVSIKELTEKYKDLGYKLDRSMDCRSMAKDIDSGQSFPNISCGIKELDTGISAFHYKDARRDKNFILMQKLRQDFFSVSRGAIFAP